MKYIKDFKELSKDDVAMAGGKGASLGEMTQKGLPVPYGFVVLAGAFDVFVRETGLYVEIEAALEEVDIDIMHTIEHLSLIHI